MLDYAKEAMPLYLQIKNELKKAIEERTYSFDSLIPGELELEKYYGVSRITVRQAILALEREGYVVRARGKGTRVIYNSRINSFPYEIKSFTQEMADRGNHVTTKYASIEKIVAGAKLSKIFSIASDHPLYHLYRVRLIDGVLSSIFNTYLNGKYTFALESERYYESLYQLFDELGIKKPVKVIETFGAELADAEVANVLGCKEGDPILAKIRKSYDVDGDLIEYSMAKFLAEKYEYVIELDNGTR